jgi:hypothetical protein
VDESSVRELVRFISVAIWTAGEGDLSGEALRTEVRHGQATPSLLTQNAISPYTSHSIRGIFIISFWCTTALQDAPQGAILSGMAIHKEIARSAVDHHHAGNGKSHRDPGGKGLHQTIIDSMKS